MAVHSGGRGESDGLADLSYRRWIAALTILAVDEIEDFLLAVRQVGRAHRVFSSLMGVSNILSIRCCNRTTVRTITGERKFDKQMFVERSSRVKDLPKIFAMRRFTGGRWSTRGSLSHPIARLEP